MAKYKYCVAQVNFIGGKHEISFYAYTNNVYGLHRVSDWNDENVIWHDTEKDAMSARFNSNDCVLSKLFE